MATAPGGGADVSNILVSTDRSELARCARPLAVELAKLQQPGIAGIPALPDDRPPISCKGALEPVTEGRIEGEAKDRVEKFFTVANSGAWSAGVPCGILRASSA